MASVFRGILDFFDQLGVYDVVLPFLMIFTIVFAILEKTKILGTEPLEGSEGKEGQMTTKKNLNSMVAFVVAFFVIASSQLVEIIIQVSSQMVILLLLSVFFLLLVGSFYNQSEEPFALNDTWKLAFTIIMFIGIVAIFLMAIKTKDGSPWLIVSIDYIVNNFDSTIVGSIMLILIILGFMYYITKERPQAKPE